MKGKLIVFSGPSGVGKGTIRKHMKFDDYVFSISSTTRNIRDGEKDGVDYHFISRDEFVKKVAQNEMLEHAEFCGNFYGTDREVVEKLLDLGKNVFLEIECQGALQVIKQMPEALSIFILPPSIKELEARLKGRNTEDLEIINMRIAKAKGEIELKDNYKYNVINDELDRVVVELDEIFKKEIYDKA